MSLHTIKLFGKRVRQLRKVKDLTQAELAEQCDLSNNFIALLERGKNSPSLFTVEKLGRALNVSLAELFEFEDEPEKITLPQRDGREKAIRKLLKAKSNKEVKLIADIAELIRKNKK